MPDRGVSTYEVSDSAGSVRHIDSGFSVCGRFASAAKHIALLAVVAAVAEGTALFQDKFSTPGTRLNLSAWTTEVGCTSFLGRTQLADWITPGGAGQFVVGPSGAQLTLNTFNPT